MVWKMWTRSETFKRCFCCHAFCPCYHLTGIRDSPRPCHSLRRRVFSPLPRKKHPLSALMLDNDLSHKGVSMPGYNRAGGFYFASVTLTLRIQPPCNEAQASLREDRVGERGQACPLSLLWREESSAMLQWCTSNTQAPWERLIKNVGFLSHMDLIKQNKKTYP